MRSLAIAALVVVASAHAAAADDACDHAQAVADARSALLVAPRLFGTVGYLEGVEPGAAGPVATNGPRVTAGLAYRIDGLFAGSATRALARAECARNGALARVSQVPAYRALAARVTALDAALGEADQILRATEAEVAEHVITEREMLATRTRVDGLRRTAADAHRQLAALPHPTGSARLETFYASDAEVEDQEARLRRLDAFEVTVRGGYDRFLDRDDDSPFFAMLSVSINTGVLFQGSAQDRAAAARRRLVRGELATAVAGIEAGIVADTARLAQTTALIAELETQLASLDRVGGDDARRYRRTVWFELVTVRAEHAELTAHVAALREVLQR